MVNKKINSKTEQVLIGSLLGDGGLQIHKKGINANFKEGHSLKQKEYMVWKKEKLGFFKPKLIRYKVFDNRTNKYYYHIALFTKVHPILTGYHKLIYRKKKKSISRSILKKIGPLALAVWYCDDGSFGYINQNGKIATYLPYKENILLANFLKERFNIKCSLNKDGKHYHLYFNVREIKKFLNLIKDHVPKCMNYKLGPLCKENINRLKEENLKRRGRDKTRREKDIKDPIKHELIKKQHRDGQKRRLQDPEHRRKHNEYHKLWQRKYRKEHKEKYNEYSRLKQREYYRKRKK